MKTYSQSVHDLVDDFEGGDSVAIDLLLPIIKNHAAFDELMTLAMMGDGVCDEVRKQILYSAAESQIESWKDDKHENSQ